MKTKKIVIALLVFITFLLIILLLKMKGVMPTSSPTQVGSNLKYSSEDIKNLILKGWEKLDNMNNVSYETISEYGTGHFYYKGTKMKFQQPNDPSYSITDLIKKKTYLVDTDKKRIIVSDSASSFSILQQQLVNSIESVDTSPYSLKHEYLYVKDEVLDGKDCIFVEEVTFVKKDGSYINVNKEYPEEEVFAFWLEKSTGLIIGRTTILPGQKSANVYKLLTNISFGTVKDSDFELPSDYEIIELK